MRSAAPRANVTENAQFDAIVIGSGLGGSSLAYKLATLGQRVLVVEQGDFLRPRTVEPGEAIGKYMYDVVAPGQPLSFVGGATKFYGAALYRLREADFREVQHEAGVSPAWPIDYSDLEPYYAEGERLYRVHGAANGDRSNPARSSPFPHEPLPNDPIVEKLVKSLERTGTPVAPIPRGLDQGVNGTCRMCGTCDGYFCQIDAKMDAEIAALRPALATGNITLLTNTICRRILTNLAGTEVEGVELLVDGKEQTLASRVVSVSCGIPGTALLLRKSRSPAHPEGLGNRNGVLGRFMGGHYSGLVFPLVSWRPLGSRHTKTIAINHFYEPSPDWPYPSGVIQIAGQMPIWEGANRLMRPIVKAIATRSLTCFYMTEAVPARDAGLVFEGDSLARIVPPPQSEKTFARLRALAVRAFHKAGYPVIPRNRSDLWHEVGTARMGADPRSSVTNSDCMVHGIEGLYVSDAPVLPSAGAVNTGLTIVALALRTGDAIVRKGTPAALQ
jgi:choline dehydrogenase-like flavoprotein